MIAADSIEGRKRHAPRIGAEEVGSWSAVLRQIADAPLEFRPDFPEVAARWESWWKCEAEHPLVVVRSPKAASVRWDKAFDLLEHPDEWVEVRRKQIEASHWTGETIPAVRVDIGPVATAAFLGVPVSISETEQTVWQTPVLDRWMDMAKYRFDSANPWFRIVRTLTERTAADAAGRYLVCLPDLTGAIDVLSNLRSAERLCLDLYENRGEVIAGAAFVVDAWEQIFALLYEAALGNGAGVIQWLDAWSDSPYTLPTCDFNFLISRKDFQDVCMPSLREQARRAGRCLFHLDGPGAARHVRTLAEDPYISAIQYTPGAGTPSALDRLDVLRAVQEAGKPVMVFAPPGEAAELAKSLDPKALAIHIDSMMAPDEADALVAGVRKVAESQ